jgi:hypothetical protein
MIRIGPDALPKLRLEATRPGFWPAHRDRILRVLRWIEVHGRQPGSAPAAVADALIDALRVKHDDVNATATDALCHLGTEIVPRLICEAYSNRGGRRTALQPLRPSWADGDAGWLALPSRYRRRSDTARGMPRLRPSDAVMCHHRLYLTRASKAERNDPADSCSNFRSLGSGRPT